MRTLVVLLTVVFLAAIVTAQEPVGGFTVETDFLRWVVDAAGHTTSFLQKADGKELFVPEQPVSFCSIRVGDATYPATGVVQEGAGMRVVFGETGATALLRIDKKPHYFVVTVESVNDDKADEITLINIPLALMGTLEEPFAACALALNLQTNVAAIPGPAKELKASAYKRFGIPGASVAVVASPMPQLREVMKEVVLAAPGLPHHRDTTVPPIGGPWALDTPGNRGSYLFDFGTLTENTVDSWIVLLGQLGFTQVDFHTGTSLRFGDCAPNPKLFPNGRASVKAVIDKLHEAGIAAGLHTYAFFIAKDTPYVTPVPDPRLGKDATFTLAAAIDEAATIVPVKESTAEVSLATGFFARNSVTLQIDNELIIFSGVTKEPPYTFTECQRGAHGTAVTAHEAGAQVHKLKECFGLFTPDANSTLLAEIAENTANTFNECGFDMIYLDALDGEDILAGAENAWHYGSKFVFEIANRLNRPALFEMSTFHHHLWYVRARMGAWDHPARSHKRFIDLHCDANRAGAGMFLPMNLGWWAAKTWQDGVASVWSEPTYPDDIEYLLCKALGNDMCLSLMGVNPDNIGNTPLYQRLLPMFSTYEELRHTGVVPESIKARLREPGSEFTLEAVAEGVWQFRPVAYHKHKADTAESSWTITNGFGQQPVRLRIEALMSAASYDSEEAVVIEDFSDTKGFDLRKTAENVSASIEKDTDNIKAGDRSGKVSVSNTGTQRTGAWVQIGRTQKPALNIDGKPALGVWVHGDNSGALLNLQQLSARHTAAGGIGDHYITLDFTGWRYFTLVEFESENVMKLGWPYGDSYSVYREHVDYKAVESFSLWLNNLPPGGNVDCLISPVKALPLVEIPMRNPVLTINGATIKFPAEIPVGASLEFVGAGACYLYGKKGELLAEITPEGTVPLLNPGENTIQFSCNSGEENNPRARVTIIAAGDVLSVN